MAPSLGTAAKRLCGGTTAASLHSLRHQCTTAPRALASDRTSAHMHAEDGISDATQKSPQARLSNTKIARLFAAAKSDGRPLYVSAPMVRYSKLPYRMLVRDYGLDVIYTPMILAHEFIRSPFARDSDFTTCQAERQATADGREHALIAQFASSESEEFARACELIAPWVDGVNLNCGCPQGWAIKEGIGCSLMSSPDLVASMVKAAKTKLPSTMSVSVKIRIAKDLDDTKHWIRTVENAGVDYITIHGRTRSQRSTTPPDYDAIKTLKAIARVPIIANGDAYSLSDTVRIASHTGVDGVMAARGLLENPSLFVGQEKVTTDCLLRFVEYCIRHPIPFQLIQHHMSDMTTNMGISKDLKHQLMDCRDLTDLIDFVQIQYSQNNELEAG